MLTGVCLFVSRRGAKGKKMEQQDSFDSSIFPNVLEWGIIMKYGLDRGKLLHFVVFILVWVVKKKVRLFQTWFFAVPEFILNSDSPTHSVWEKKNRFSHFSEACIPLNLQCKFDKHTTSYLAGEFLVCIYFIAGADWDGVVLWSSNIAAENTHTRKNWC